MQESCGPLLRGTELNLLQVRHTALAQFHGPRRAVFSKVLREMFVLNA
jgi:hypothetical protein